MKFIKTPSFFRRLFPTKVWRFFHAKNTIFLTFDDGPIPEVTPWVLTILKEHNAKATFFCVGENIQKHPELFQRILDEGHEVGNHTMNHLNGWKTPKKAYLDNIKKASNFIDSNLFRPPYGKCTFSQTRKIKQHYKIIMWSFLTYDFDEKIDMSTIFQKIKRQLKAGDIIVMHDSLKAEKNLKQLLPETLNWIKEKGFSAQAITSVSCKSER